MYSAHLSVAKVRDVEKFIEARARVQRLSDRKFFNGWLMSLSHSHALLRMNSECVADHDVFSVEVSGSEHAAFFLGEVSSIGEQRVDLKVTNGVTLMPPTEAARFRKFGFEGRLKVDAKVASFMLTDISDDGMGLLTSFELTAGTLIDFELMSPVG